MSAKILFVDDEPDLESLISQRFRKKIRAEKWQLFFAHNGVQALEKVKQHPDIDIIVTDLNMPEMDGLTLLSKLNQINLAFKTIVISAYGDMKNIRNAMNFGAFDFLTKPIDFQDLEITLNKTLREVQQVKENQRLRESEARAREEAQHLQNCMQDLKKTQAQLIQTAKMSSLGQVVAGIAHEINNPVNFIYGNISHVSDYIQDLLHLLHLYQQYAPPNSEIQAEIEAIDLEFIIVDLPQIMVSMKGGVDRIQKIILSLRNFSRLDEANIKSVDIHEGIKSSLLILHNRFQARAARPEIQVIEEYSNLPLVECYAGELNQVFINILSNAIDALNEYNKHRSLDDILACPLTITIRTFLLEEKSRVVIQIRDNGPGITAEVKDRIFEPFFTTKPVGEGTGLGLYISYQIVHEKHGGALNCFSEVGQGTELWIEIPIRQTRATLNLS
ncbi:hybrid sensor histidine kinase/response regulator [Microcoleus vaginatus PCC 9802]|uniref:hybrid sensor histidine kinase/response regulator n=1 Tax=Microcoleus vaginatus TaxID=119532 RepID=UPI00020D11C2|nr:response regulator receiver sensor signal transduction histidine kinase [Microcoleus vaginatus FGP-2]UNU18312.1 hybrid sensor histidine kinase/response regulator [Microcoleus vaginatus PCC 9802]